MQRCRARRRRGGKTLSTSTSAGGAAAASNSRTITLNGKTIAAPLIVAEPSAWRGADVRDKVGDWTYHLTPADVAEVHAALAACKAKGLSGTAVTAADFVLPKFGATIHGWSPEMNQGRGFMLVDGSALADLSDEDLRTVFYGIGHYLGVPLSQNSYGDMLGDVLDEGVKMGSGRVRGYRTNQRLRFHTDRADVVGLLCLHAAKTGGMSSIVSSTAIYNEIMRNHPEYLEPLLNGYVHATVEEGGAVNTVRIPVYSIRDGVVSCRILRNTIESTRTRGYTEHTDLEAAALAYMDALTERADLRLDMDLKRGDMQFINNYTTLHARTEFEDYDDGRPRRHLLRLWLKFARWPRLVDADDFWDYHGVEKTLERKAA